MRASAEFITRFLFCCVFFHLHSAFALPYFSDDFETGDTSHAENGFHWTAKNHRSNCSGGAPTVVTNIAHRGTHSLRFKFCGSANDDAFSEIRQRFGQNLTEVYVRWYQYFPDGTEGLGAKYHIRNSTGTDNNKWFRTWGISTTEDGQNGYTNRSTGFGASLWQAPDNSSIATYELGHQGYAPYCETCPPGGCYHHSHDRHRYPWQCSDNQRVVARFADKLDSWVLMPDGTKKKHSF